MRKGIISFFAVTLVIMAGFLNSEKAFASDDSGLSYTVTPILPENQDDNVTSYISIIPDGSSLTQDVEFLIENNSNNSLTLDVEPINALTSPQKGIQYTSNKNNENAKLIDGKYSLVDYIDVENSIKLEAGEIKTLRVTLDVSELEGTLLGAISFKDSKQEKTKNQGEQFQIHNEIKQIIGFQVNFPTKETPNFVIDDPHLEQMASYYVIRLPITFEAPLLLKDVSMNYKVATLDGETLFESNEDEVFNTAPKSKTNFSLPWEHETIKEGGKYILTGSLIYEDENIEFKKEFEFNVEKPTEQKESKVFQVPSIDNNSNWWIIVGVIAVIVSIVLFVIWRMRKKSAENKATHVG